MTSCRIAAPRSRPRPVSMFSFGQRRERAVGVQLVRHEDEVPELEEAGAARARRRAVRLAAAVLLAPVPEDLRVRARTARARPRTRSSRRSAAGRSAPPASRPSARARSRPRRARASAAGRRRGRSPRRDPSRASCARTRTRGANSIAPSLKYCPNEKLPSISKNVRWWPSRPDLVDVDGAEAPSATGSSAAPAEAPGRGRTASAAACPH